jgi:hypothetical protein
LLTSCGQLKNALVAALTLFSDIACWALWTSLAWVTIRAIIAVNSVVADLTSGALLADRSSLAVKTVLTVDTWQASLALRALWT